MNDSFEDRLKSLKPGTLPDTLRRRLDLPPPSPRSRRVIPAGFAAAAAACLAALLWRESAVPPPGPVNAGVPAFAGQRSSQVTGVQPLSVITDESNRLWKMMEVNWVEEDTLVSAARPSAVRTQDHYRTVVPVAVQFD